MMTFRKGAFWSLLTAGLFLSGGTWVMPSTPEPPAPQSTKTTTKKKGTAKLRGTVSIKGTIPKPVRIRTEADPKCAAMHRRPMFSDDIVADPKGRVTWAFIYIKSGLEGQTFEIPKKPAVVTQRMCRFEPHVLGVMVGQKLQIRNLDKLMHIVHVRPNSNREWAFSQDLVGESRDKVFTQKEMMIRLFCDVHPWMTCWVAVLDHPFHTVSGRFGKYEMKDLPAGKYTIEAWHEKFEPVTQEVELKDRKTVTLDFTFTTPK